MATNGAFILSFRMPKVPVKSWLLHYVLKERRYSSTRRLHPCISLGRPLKCNLRGRCFKPYGFIMRRLVRRGLRSSQVWIRSTTRSFSSKCPSRRSVINLNTFNNCALLAWRSTQMRRLGKRQLLLETLLMPSSSLYDRSTISSSKMLCSLL